MSLPSFQADRAKWMFHVTKAHLVDDNKRSACGRTLETVDLPSESWDGKSHKCVTCEKYALKFIVKEGSEKQ
jgi:hypothetical protein